MKERKQLEKMERKLKAEVRGGKVGLWGLYLTPVLGWLFVPSKTKRIRQAEMDLLSVRRQLRELEA